MNDVNFKKCALIFFGWSLFCFIVVWYATNEVGEFVSYYNMSKPWEYYIVVILSILLIVLYGVIVRYFESNGFRSNLIQDSFYYLGFLLTLVSMVASFSIIGDNDGFSNISEIIKRNGIALTTTIFGLLTRICLKLYFKQEAHNSLASLTDTEIADKTELLKKLKTTTKGANADLSSLKGNLSEVSITIHNIKSKLNLFK